jgi:multiple sugar transport system permease protein
MFMFAFGERLSTVPNIDLTRGWTAIGLLSSTATMYRNGLFVFLLRQYFVNQPKELEEAAYIDGAGTVKTFLNIMLPSAKTMMITVGLFSFVWIWLDSDFSPTLMPDMPLLANQFDKIASIGFVAIKS